MSEMIDRGDYYEWRSGDTTIYADKTALQFRHSSLKSEITSREDDERKARWMCGAAPTARIVDSVTGETLWQRPAEA